MCIHFRLHITEGQEERDRERETEGRETCGQEALNIIVCNAEAHANQVGERKSGLLGEQERE